MHSFILALFASAAIVSANSCAQDNLDFLAARVPCGNSGLVAKCLRANVDLGVVEDVKECLMGAGCELKDATAEAVWFALDCRAGNQELRKRQDDTETEDSTTEAPKTTQKTTTAKTTAKTSSTSAPSSTKATTTSESTSSKSTSSTSSQSTATSTTSSSSSSKSHSSARAYSGMLSTQMSTLR